MNSPGTTPHEPCGDAGPQPRTAPNGYCDLCGERNPHDPDIEVITGLWICTDCVEGLLDASANDPRAEVGMVGSCGVWS